MITHIHSEDMRDKKGSYQCIPIEEAMEMPIFISYVPDMERTESGIIAVGLDVFSLGWGTDCPAHNEGIHKGFPRCCECGARE
jgi:hypothetical protein